MRALDRAVAAILALVRGRRRTRLDKELDAALSEAQALGGHVPSEILPERHTRPHDGLSEPSAGLLRRRLKDTASVLFLAGAVVLQVYVYEAREASASEEAQWAAYEEAADDYTAALYREGAALDAAVAVYSAEREAAGASLPEDVAAERVREERPELSASEVADEVDGGGNPFGPAHTETAAMEMWSWEPPRTETAREAIQAYEAAEKAADEAEADYEMAWEDVR